MALRIGSLCKSYADISFSWLFWDTVLYRFRFGDTEPDLELFREDVNHLVVVDIGWTVVKDATSNARVGVADRGKHCGVNEERNDDTERRCKDDRECTTDRQHVRHELRPASDERPQTQQRAADCLELSDCPAIPLHQQHPAQPIICNYSRWGEEAAYLCDSWSMLNYNLNS